LAAALPAVSNAEDPEKLLDQVVNEMQEDLIKMRQASAQVCCRLLLHALPAKSAGSSSAAAEEMKYNGSNGSILAISVCCSCLPKAEAGVVHVLGY
jgi:hypothetical protein